MARYILSSRDNIAEKSQRCGITRFFTITNNKLDNILRNCLDDFLWAGEVMLRGQLVSLDLHIPRQRLRLSLERLGCQKFYASAITRQTYSVPVPNALWHTDGKNELICWGFVVHAVIDGYSRLITYIECSDNNRADTVMKCFCGGYSRIWHTISGEDGSWWGERENLGVHGESTWQQ